jgi:hypothetical protein
MTGLPIITLGLISIRSVTVITSSGERSHQRKYITCRMGPDSRVVARARLAHARPFFLGRLMAERSRASR